MAILARVISVTNVCCDCNLDMTPERFSLFTMQMQASHYTWAVWLTYDVGADLLWLLSGIARVWSETSYTPSRPCIRVAYELVELHELLFHEEKHELWEVLLWDPEW
jgi:hypothetical protein